MPVPASSSPPFLPQSPYAALVVHIPCPRASSPLPMHSMHDPLLHHKTDTQTRQPEQLQLTKKYFREKPAPPIPLLAIMKQPNGSASALVTKAVT